MDAFGIQGSKCLISSFSLNLLTREYSPEEASLTWSPVDAGGRGLDNTGSYSNYKWLWAQDLHSKESVSLLKSSSLPDPPNLIYYRGWEADQGGPRALEKRKARGVCQNRRPCNITTGAASLCIATRPHTPAAPISTSPPTTVFPRWKRNWLWESCVPRDLVQ